MKPTLERSGVSMAGASSLAIAFVPKIEAAELEKTKRELDGAMFCNVFDGTRRLGEVLAMVSRFCTTNFDIMHRLTMFKTLKANATGKQLAQLTTRRLLTELELPASSVTGWARDSCSANGTAVSDLQVTFSCSDDILCFAHTIGNSGDHMDFPAMKEVGRERRGGGSARTDRRGGAARHRRGEAGPRDVGVITSVALVMMITSVALVMLFFDGREREES